MQNTGTEWDVALAGQSRPACITGMVSAGSSREHENYVSKAHNLSLVVTNQNLRLNCFPDFSVPCQ